MENPNTSPTWKITFGLSLFGPPESYRDDPRAASKTEAYNSLPDHSILRLNART